MAVKSGLRRTIFIHAGVQLALAIFDKILMDYNENKTFIPEKLRMVDYHIEGRTGENMPYEYYEKYLNGEYGNTIFYFDRKAPLENWSLENPKQFFKIRDTDNKRCYKITLDL